jgi:hypothetical protein
MTRLPIPGEDDSTWGNILNDFLLVSHFNDGTLKIADIVAAKYVKPAGGIPETDLSSGIQAKLNTAVVDTSELVPKTTKVNGYALTNDVTVTKADIGLGNVDDTTDAAKPVSVATQTALNAKADTSTVTSGLAGKADTAHSHTIADVTNLQSALNTKYVLPAGGIPQSDLDEAISGKLDAVGSIADGSVGTSKLADNAVTAVKITDDTIVESKLSSSVRTKLNQAGPDLSNFFNKTTNTTDDITESTAKKFLLAADKAKLDGIQSGADVNVNADWNATSGAAQILNKPAIPSVPVQSVNTKTGTVILTPDDLSDTNSTNKFTNAADKAKLAAISGTNTGDQTSVTGNAGTATALQTARTINGVAFDGTVNISVSAAHNGTSDTITQGTNNLFLTTTERTKIAATTGTNSGDQDLSGLTPKTTKVNGHALSGDVTVTKADVGLGNVDNTSDLAKPISTATQDALNTKPNLTDVQAAFDAKANSADVSSALATKVSKTGDTMTGRLNVSSTAPVIIDAQTSRVTHSATAALYNTNSSTGDGASLHIMNTTQGRGTSIAHVLSNGSGSDKGIFQISGVDSTGLVDNNTPSLAMNYAGKSINLDASGGYVALSSGSGSVFVDTNGVTTQGNIDVSYANIHNLANPLADSDAANKIYVDTKASDSLVVHKAGAETITGSKTFSATQAFSSGLTTTGITLNAGTITTDTTTGLKIGTASTQKVGFFNATPAQQQSSVSDLGAILATFGFRVAGGSYTLATNGSVSFSGAFSTTANVRSGVSSQTAAVTLNLTTSSEYQMCNATTAAFNLTLPGTTVVGYRFTIKKIDSSANAITIVAASIDGVANYTLSTQYKYVTLVSGGVSGTWYIVANN